MRSIIRLMITRVNGAVTNGLKKNSEAIPGKHSIE